MYMEFLPILKLKKQNKALNPQIKYYKAYQTQKIGKNRNNVYKVLVDYGRVPYQEMVR